MRFHGKYPTQGSVECDVMAGKSNMGASEHHIYHHQSNKAKDLRGCIHVNCYKSYALLSCAVHYTDCGFAIVSLS